ncbi:MAG: hypothetical protein WCT41_01610 [Candidatus Paceibacterota bacterium]|jgi:hypothetical protein
MNALNAIPVIMLISCFAVALDTAWRWLRKEHLIPVLTRALQYIDEGFDDPFEWPISAEIARTRLKEIRHYENRLWVLSDSKERECWKERLETIAQVYPDVIEAEGKELTKKPA